MAPSVAVKPSSAVRDGGLAPAATPTCGFQPVIRPASEAKMNTAALVLVPSVTEKSVALPVLLKTWPVGDPPGMATLNGWVSPLPATSPAYSSLRSLWLAEIQKAPPVGLREMPQALTRVGSVIRATPGRSAIRLVARYAVLGLERSSSLRTASGTRGDGRGMGASSNDVGGRRETAPGVNRAGRPGRARFPGFSASGRKRRYQKGFGSAQKAARPSTPGWRDENHSGMWSHFGNVEIVL